MLYKLDPNCMFFMIRGNLYTSHGLTDDTTKSDFMHYGVWWYGKWMREEEDALQPIKKEWQHVAPEKLREVESRAATGCSKIGQPHLMYRVDCYETVCVNKGCFYSY